MVRETVTCSARSAGGALVGVAFGLFALLAAGHGAPEQHAARAAALAYGEPGWIELWKTLPADSTVDEVVRNFFVRQPLLWVDRGAAAR